MRANRTQMIGPAPLVALTVALVAVIMLAGCAGKRPSAAGFQPLAGSRSSRSVAPAGKPTPTLEEALAELKALPCPEGVDGALWDSLKGTLREALQAEERPVMSRRGSLAPLLDSEKEPGWLARRTQEGEKRGRRVRSARR